MKKAILLSATLLGIGVLVLLARALPNVGPMVTVPLEQAADPGGRVEGIDRARTGWSAISLVLVSGFCFVAGWLWVPLVRRVVAWAERQPAIKDVFHYKGVRFVSSAPTESLLALACVAFFPLWVILPALHHMVGRALLPVPDHLIAESLANAVMCVPLAVGYGLYWRGRERPDVAEDTPAA